MKIIARILIAIVALATCLGWMLPIGLSLYLTKTAPAIAKVVPTDLADSSISQASGTKLSYLRA
ncbi:MAG TPA: hypothetical protein VFE61_10885 [Candidatus Sulfotelmatobacter sp.]|nr:hypothetical protein [Candidatus Sulfotelmatobacter sp.]